MRPAFTLRQLECFATVADRRTMAAAAEDLHLSQSAVSLAVANLEKVLEVQLFVRGAHGLALTAAGRNVLSDAHQLLDQADGLQAGARSQGERLTGRLVVGCIPALTRHLGIAALREFPEAHPGVEIDPMEGRADDVREWLLEGRCEVGLTYALGPAQSLQRITLYESRPHVLLPPGHRLTGATSVRLVELRRDSLIMLSAPAAAGYFTELLRAAGLDESPRYRMAAMESARALVAAGAGYTLVMHHPGSTENTVPVEHDGNGLGVVLALPGHGRLTRRARAFVSFMRLRCG